MMERSKQHPRAEIRFEVIAKIAKENRKHGKGARRLADNAARDRCLWSFNTQ